MCDAGTPSFKERLISMAEHYRLNKRKASRVVRTGFVDKKGVEWVLV